MNKTSKIEKYWGSLIDVVWIFFVVDATQFYISKAVGFPTVKTIVEYFKDSDPSIFVNIVVFFIFVLIWIVICKVVEYCWKGLKWIFNK